MLVGRNVVVRTAREADLDGRYDLIADVRTNGNHWPLTMGSKSEWTRRFRENGWWIDGVDRMLVTCPRQARRVRELLPAIPQPSETRNRLPDPPVGRPQQGVLARRHWPCEIAQARRTRA
jgi:hypothetical protein